MTPSLTHLAIAAAFGAATMTGATSAVAQTPAPMAATEHTSFGGRTSRAVTLLSGQSGSERDLGATRRASGLVAFLSGTQISRNRVAEWLSEHRQFRDLSSRGGREMHRTYPAPFLTASHPTYPAPLLTGCRRLTCRDRQDDHPAARLHRSRQRFGPQRQLHRSTPGRVWAVILPSQRQRLRPWVRASVRRRSSRRSS